MVPRPGAVSVKRLLGRVLFEFRGDGTPFLRCDVGDVLREGPAMSLVILSGVLPLPERHVGRWFENPGAKSLGAIEMAVHVVHAHVHVLGDFARTRRAERPVSKPEHDGSLRNGELSVADPTIAARRPETFPKPESAA